jgi:sporulation protein YlmC with PRC-barrel domain
MRPNEVDLALHLLDDQILDAEGKRCGRVDDVELKGGPREATAVAALLVGPAVWPARLPRPLDSALQLLVPGPAFCVDWEVVQEVNTTVNLSRKAEELGIGQNDGRSVRWTGATVEDRVRLTDLMGKLVVDERRQNLGRVQDVRAERMTPDPSEGKVREPWVVTGLLVGKLGVLQRLGVTREEREERTPEARPPPNFVGWARIDEIGPDVIRVSSSD